MKKRVDNLDTIEYDKLSLINLRTYGSSLKYPTDNVNLIDLVSISYTSSLINDLTKPKTGLKVPENFFNEPESESNKNMYQYLTLNCSTDTLS